MDKTNSKFDFKFKEALIINIIAKENHLAVTLSL